MPISSFGDGLRHAVSFLPGTYGTALVRTHSMRGALSELEGEGVPGAAIEEIKGAIDCNVSFFNNKVGEGAAYLVLAGSVLLLIGAYILISYLASKRKKAN
jgi:multidrug/hemolysin transport system permease protein